MATKKRSRTVRRELERAKTKLGHVREALEALEPGGAPTHPIEVESASQVEPHARAMHCPVCDDAYRVVEHEATHGAQGSLRVVTITSPRCGRTRKVWFRLRPALVN